MSLVNLGRKTGETELAYIKRLGEAKDAGLIDMTCAELANVFNKNLRDSGVEYTESAYRKKYATMKQFTEEFTPVATDAEELIDLKRELEKEKIKVRDERNEYRKLIREEARKESYQEQFLRSIEDMVGKYALEYDNDKKVENFFNPQSSLLIPLYDLHAGIEIQNSWNIYDGDVLRHRLNHYLDRIFEIQKRHCANNAYVCCSELLSGIIHPSLRIQNNQDLIDQFLMVCDYVCDFLAELSYRFDKVHVYVAPGNHSRINSKKDQDLTHENMDNLLIPFLRAKMQLFDNIRCYENVVEQTMAVFDIYQWKVCAIHGDKDSFENAADRINKLLRTRVDIILTGHKHTNQFCTSADVKCIQSGCMSGPDEYALNLRMRNRPEQALCVITDSEGLDCIYDIKF